MDIDDISKPQNVRLADVFVLGPLSIWFGVRANEMPTWARVAMIAYGTGTIVYNGKNYLDKEKSRKMLEAGDE
jgi:hypothetical protein